ncbi:hypothetical protein IMSHALPRED_009648 [Imshaugia aleurites]|uniref:Uncharacterized protein n=1 Tax=Imshaugia aleurites TaxID=172621 RepID=A0A8H3G091_9LECA|nr:hypothetical protein IMSHALPRED_009648 [Imshaugia aleurites]
MELDQPGEDVPHVNYAGGLGPSFSKLSRELRDQVYSELLISGNPHFMCLSKVVRIEGEALIYRKGVCRMNFGFDLDTLLFTFLKGSNDDDCPRPTKEIAQKTQNLSIQVKARYRLPRLDSNGQWEVFQQVSMFMGFPLRHMSCRTAGSCSVSAFFRDMIHILRSLIAFDTVELHVYIDSNCDDTLPWSRNRVKEGIDVVRESVFAMARKDTEPYVGNEVLYTDKDGLRLIIRPRKVQGEIVQNSVQELHSYVFTWPGT